MTLHDLKLYFEGWQHTTREIKRLRDLDNRLLADMGISRQDIADLVSGRHRR